MMVNKTPRSAGKLLHEFLRREDWLIRRNRHNDSTSNPGFCQCAGKLLYLCTRHRLGANLGRHDRTPHWIEGLNISGEVSRGSFTRRLRTVCAIDNIEGGGRHCLDSLPSLRILGKKRFSGGNVSEKSQSYVFEGSMSL